MNIVEKIELNREQILPELYEWAETFDWELDEYGERTDVPYLEIYTLVQRLENGQCTKDDYKNILFHIEQINHNEIKLTL